MRIRKQNVLNAIKEADELQEGLGALGVCEKEEFLPTVGCGMWKGREGLTRGQVKRECDQPLGKWEGGFPRSGEVRRKPVRQGQG